MEQPPSVYPQLKVIREAWENQACCPQHKVRILTGAQIPDRTVGISNPDVLDTEESWLTGRWWGATG